MELPDLPYAVLPSLLEEVARACGASVRVRPRVEHGDGSGRSSPRPAVGICGDPAGEPGALFLRAVASHLPADFLLVLPELRRNLYALPGGGRLYTRTFARGVAGVVTVHVSPRPVPLDVVHDFYGWPTLAEPLRHCAFAPAEVEAVSLDKRLNKAAFAAAGVKAPRWTSFEPRQNLDAGRLARGLEGWSCREGLRRLVVKPVARSGGSGVRFFDSGDTVAAARWACGILRRGEAVLAEEAFQGAEAVLADGRSGQVAHVRAHVLRTAGGSYVAAGLKTALAEMGSPLPHVLPRVVSFDAVREWQGWSVERLRKALRDAGAAAAEAFARDIERCGLPVPDQVAVDLLPVAGDLYGLELDTGGVGTEIPGEAFSGRPGLIHTLVRRAAELRRCTQEDVSGSFEGLVELPWGPHQAEAWTTALQFFLEAGDQAAADWVMDEGLARHPKASALRFARAMLRLSRGQVRTAAADLSEILVREPDHGPSIDMLARLGVLPAPREEAECASL